MDTAISVRERRRVRVRWIVLGLVAVLVLCAVWVVVRALIARDQLVGAIPLASEIRTSVLEGRTDGLDASIEELRSRAELAATLTSDPIWRVTEFVPILGPNLTSFREAAAVIRDVADDALPELGELASTITVDSFGIVDGRIDLAPIIDAAPHVAAASDALDRAAEAAGRIDTSSTIAQVGESVDQLVDLVTETRDLVGALDNAVQLLPPMLGADGPRSYLLLSLNNAELRATGGIPGAIAVVTIDDGAIAIGDTAAARDLGRFDEPVLPLTEDESILFGRRPALFMQNVTLTPDFARSGELAREMWRLHSGQTVDGVLALDPVALGYVLRSVGPVYPPNGVVLDSETAADHLLNEVYLSEPDAAAQDAFFSSVTGLVLSALTERQYDRRALLDALTQATDEGRLKIWSAEAGEQAIIGATGFAGTLPRSDAQASTFGVYLNDGTGAKADFYLRMDVDVDSGQCGPEAQPTYDVNVGLTSTMPADAATSLPLDITGGGLFGIEAGSIATNLHVYAPPGMEVVDVTVEGRPVEFLEAPHDGHVTASLRSTLLPGDATQISVRFVATGDTPLAVGLAHTPLASPVPVALNGYLDCAPR